MESTQLALTSLTVDDAPLVLGHPAVRHVVHADVAHPVRCRVLVELRVAQRDQRVDRGLTTTLPRDELARPNADWHVSSPIVLVAQVWVNQASLRDFRRSSRESRYRRKANMTPTTVIGARAPKPVLIQSPIFICAFWMDAAHTLITL